MADWPGNVGRIELQSVDSTLNEAARVAGDLLGPTWIFAHKQTQARGRRGRAWKQPKGNFSATLVLPDAGPPDQAALRSFVMSLALFDALSGVSTGEFTLKWPNDVLLNGGKLAGILLEGLPNGALAIGIGINLTAAPDADEVEEGAVTPVSLNGIIAPLDFLTPMAQAFAARETQFKTLGFAAIRTAWLAQAARLGQRIRVRLPSEEFFGTFMDVDEQGCLVLSTDQGPRKIAAGDVFF